MKKYPLFLLLIFVINFSYAEERQVNFIVVEGNNRVSTEEIIQYSSVEIGKSYTQEDVSQIIKRLFSTNLFTDINVRIIDTTLTIIVSETPIISKILVEGNKLVETEQILSSLKSIGISQSKPYGKNLIDKIEQELTRLYYDNGRYSSSIELSGAYQDNNLVELLCYYRRGRCFYY